MSYAEKSDAQFFREVEEGASSSVAKSSTRKTEKKEKETRNDKSNSEDLVETLSVSPSKKSKKVETPKKKPGPKSKTAKKIGKLKFNSKFRR